MLTNQEHWELRYRARPYLREASDAALAQRAKDLTNNMMTLTQEGKVGVLPPSRGGERWMELFTHILEECKRRRISPQNILSGVPIPNVTAPEFPKSAAALKGIQTPTPGQTLIKLGRRDHMQDIYRYGRIRIAPASSYSDPSLNWAISDDELKLDQIVRASEIVMTLLDRETEKPRRVISPIGEITKTTRLATDYYVYCMTLGLDYRLFDDFEAEACVVIRDAKTFKVRLLQAVDLELANWIDWDRSVTYVDPYLHNSDCINLFFSKHFRFWYQKEYRFCWIPPLNKHPDFAPFFVELGSIQQISDIVIL